MKYHYLFNVNYDKNLGIATEEQVEASDKADYGELGDGVFWIDIDGHPTTETDPYRPGFRRVYTWHE